MSSSSMCRRPAVSTIRHWWPTARASASAELTMAAGSWSSIGWWTFTPGLGPDGEELLARRRTVHVGGDEQRMVALLHEPGPELGRGRRLARALQPGHEDDGGQARRGLEARRLLSAEQRHHLVAHDPDDGLGGGEALEDFLAGGLGAHALQEILGDLEVDVGLEEGEADLAQGGIDVRLGQGPLPAEGAEHPFELVAESVEHGGEVLPGGRRTQTAAPSLPRLKAK